MDIKKLGKSYVEINIWYDGEHIVLIQEMMRPSDFDQIPAMIRREIEEHEPE